MALSIEETAKDRNATIAAIKDALKKRSGKPWSVTGGRGTAWGWIRMSAPPARLQDGVMTDADRAELGQLLGLDGPVHCQGESIPASSADRRHYLCRAINGNDVGHPQPEPYWD